MRAFPITRRNFLQRLSAAGGSTLAFGALNAWELMGPPAGRRPMLSGGGGDARVVVLGAGLSGLAVGYELGKLGYDYRILEARDRVGGVAHTVRRGTEETELESNEHQVCEFDEGQYFNAGPWRIPHTHTAVLDYCRELNVPLEIFVNETDANYLYYEGDHIGELSGRRVRLREVKADLRGHTSELLAKAVHQEQLDLPLTEEDAERLVRYLVNEGFLDSQELAYRGSPARGSEELYGLTALLEAGFGNQVRAIDSGISRAPMFQPIGGMDQIPRGFERVIGDRIVLGAEVLSIRQTEDEARVVYRDRRTGEDHEVVADYVVSCLPLSVLSRLDVNLSREMEEAVENTRYSSSAKIGLQMRRRFWEEDEGIYGGRAYTNLPLGQFCYPSNGYFTAKGVLLGFYGNGDIEGLSEKSPAERIEHVLTHSSKFHPQMREEFETGYCAFWGKIRFSHGAYASNPGEGLARLQEPDHRIYLGCAAASQSPAWMEGAFSAAWQTVEKLHIRVAAG
jgi:monoamine oxidase